MKFVKVGQVSASMAGSDENLSVIGSFQIIENAITEFMGELKIDGITAKEKYNALWVFAKTRVKFFKKLLWNEQFKVSCFISFKSLVKLCFDVEVRNASQELCFYARVEGCALDITTQRIRKISTVGVDETMMPEKSLIDIAFSNATYSNLPLYEQIKIRSTNIDMSHHTNNLEYIRFLLNTYSVKELETKTIKEMEVVYVNQSFEGDVLDVLKLSDKNKDVIILQKADKQIIKCEINF